MAAEKISQGLKIEVLMQRAMSLESSNPQSIWEQRQTYEQADEANTAQPSPALPSPTLPPDSKAVHHQQDYAAYSSQNIFLKP